MDYNAQINKEKTNQQNKQLTEKQIAMVERKEEQFLDGLGNHAVEVKEAGMSQIKVKQPEQVERKKEIIHNRLFEANGLISEQANKPKMYSINSIVTDIGGIKMSNSKKYQKARNALTSKIMSQFDTKKKLGGSMKTSMKRVVDTGVDFEKIKSIKQTDLKDRINTFSKFKYAGLAAYKKDADFQKNYVAIMKDISKQIEDGYAVRRYYYETEVTAKEEGKYLSAMAKLATLERIKEYMKLRADLIANPYYAVNDISSLLKMSNEDLESQLQVAVDKQNGELAAFLGTILSIKLLGFKEDGTGRRDVEAQILKDNKDSWKKERSEVFEYSKYEKSLAYLNKEKAKYEKLIKIEDNKRIEAEKQAAEAERKKVEEAEKVKQAIKEHREEWIKKLEPELAEAIPWLSFDTYKENLLKHLASDWLKVENLKVEEISKIADENNKYHRIVSLFVSRIKEKASIIDYEMENSMMLKELTYNLPERKELVKRYLIEQMAYDDKLLVNAEKFNFEKYVTNEFVESVTDNKMKKHYYEIRAAFPALAEDENVWTSRVNEELLSLDDEKFETELKDMKSQADFCDEYIRGIIADAVEAGKININLRDKLYECVKKNLKATVYFAPIEQIKIETARLIENPSILFLTNPEKLAENEKFKNPQISEEEQKKWRVKKLRNPIEAFGNRVLEKSDIFKRAFMSGNGNIDSASISEYILAAMKESSEVAEKISSTIDISKIEDLSELSYRELAKIVDLVCDNVLDSSSYYYKIEEMLSPEIRKRVLGKMMLKKLDEDEIKDALEKSIAEQQAEDELKKTDKKIMISKFRSLGFYDKKELNYNYRAVEGAKLFNRSIFGINVRTADFKVAGRLDKVKKAEQIWDKLDSQGLTEEVLKRLSAGENITDIVKDENISDCAKELMLLGCGKEILGIGGLGESAVLAYSDSDYAKGIKSFDYLVNDFLQIEMIVDGKYGSDNSVRTKQKKLQMKKALRSYAAQFKHVTGHNDVNDLQAAKYNKEKFGVENFSEMLLMFTETSEEDMLNAAAERDRKVITLAGFLGDEYKLTIMPLLISQKDIMRKLFETSNENDDELILLANAVKEKMDPFMKALAKVAQPQYVKDQYINNNFDAIFAQCNSSEVNAEEAEKNWITTINKFSEQLYGAEIEGRGSINSLLVEAGEYANYICKNGGEFRLSALLNEKPELFRMLIEDKAAFEKNIKESFSYFDQNESAIKSYLKKCKLPQNKSDEALVFVEKALANTMYSKHLLTDKNDSFKSNLENQYKKFLAYDEEKNSDVALAKKQTAEYYSNLVENARNKIGEKKAQGIKTDTDFAMLLDMEKAVNANPYIYLTSKMMGKSLKKEDVSDSKKETDKNVEDDQYSMGYTLEEAKKSREEVDQALKKMHHEEELPESIKKFMAEVNFAESKINLYDELRYVIGLYRALSDHYKYSQDNVPDNVQDIIERAVVYNYIAQKDHDIDESGEMIYKYQDEAEKEEISENQENQESGIETYSIAGLDDEFISEREKNTEYFGEKYSYYDLSYDEEETVRKYREKKQEEDLKNAKKEEKAAKKKKEQEEKKLKDEKEFEKKHKEFLIPKLDVVDLGTQTQSFDDVYKINIDLQKKVSDGSIKDPALLSEYKFFLKNIQLSMYCMPKEEFTAFVERRLAYFDYADKAYNVMRSEIEAYRASVKQREENKPKEKQKIPVFSDIEYELANYREYFRGKIAENLQNGADIEDSLMAFHEDMRNILQDDIMRKAMEPTAYSFDDNLGSTRFRADQNKLFDLTELISKSEDADAMKQYKKLSLDEKLLFAAALSFTNDLTGDLDKPAKDEKPDDSDWEKQKKRLKNYNPSCGFIEKDGTALNNLDGIKAAFEAYVNDKSVKFDVDFSKALYNLKDWESSGQSAYQEITDYKTKPVLNKTAFKAAMTLIEVIKAKKDEANALDLATLGNSNVSLEYAAKHSRSQAYEASKRTCKDMGDFMGHLTELAQKDLSRTGNVNIYNRAKNLGHGIIERIDKTALTKRLTNMNDEEKHLFVMLLQDRTILDYCSENREDTFIKGGVIGRVNEGKRELIKSAYVAGMNSRKDLLLPASKKNSLNSAIKTLLSFQLRDGVAIKGNKETDYVETSINRSTLMDWELIHQAFKFMDEIKNEAAKMDVIRRSSDWIAYSGNTKASAAYYKLSEKVNEKNVESFDENDFMEFFGTEEIKGELDEKQSALLDGFAILSDAQKKLFFRALENRSILDISNKHTKRNFIFGVEDEYVNTAGRYDLLDEYIKNSRTGLTSVATKSGMQFNALKSLLSTQIDDDADFVKYSNSKKKEGFPGKKFLISKVRNTAIDWDLFENALQFVVRAENEAKITYEDAELVRVMGNLEANGEFKFNPSFLRRNMRVTGDRLGNFLMGRLRTKIRENIPVSGNIRQLLSYVLNVDTLNEVSKSGALAVEKDKDQEETNENVEKKEEKGTEKDKEKDKENDKDKDDDPFELTDEKTLEIFKENVGFAEYARMAEIIKAITTNLNFGEKSEELDKYVTAIENAQSDIVKIITQAKTDKGVLTKILNADIDNVMGFAILMSGEAGFEDTSNAITSIYDDVKKVKEDIRKTFNAFMSDQNMLEKITSVQFTGIIDVIGKYKNVEAFDIIKKTAEHSRKIAQNLGGAILNYNKGELDENGEPKDFLDLNKSVTEQLGIDEIFEATSDFAEYFTTDKRTPKIIKETHAVTKNIATMLTTILAEPKLKKTAYDKLEEVKKDTEEKRKALKEAVDKAGSEEELKAAKKELEEFEKSSKKDVAGYEKALKMTTVDSVDKIVQSVNLADMGKLVSLFMEDENASVVGKYSHHLNVIKDQISKLYKDFNESDETKDFITKFNLDNLMKISEVEGEKSYVGLAAKSLAGTAKIVQNGFKMLLKSQSGEVKIDGKVVRGKDESILMKKDENGELKNRSVSDVLNQVGVDEAFEIAKVAALLDPSGQGLKYVTATQELKNKTVTVIENVNEVLKDANYENIKKVTDLDECITAIQGIMKLNDTTGRYAALLQPLNDAVKIKKELTGIYDAMAADGNFFKKLDDLNVDEILSYMRKADKESAVGTLGSVLSEAKKIYASTYGLYKTGADIVGNVQKFIKGANALDAVNETAEKIYNSFKDNKIVGGKLTDLYKSGALNNMVKAGVVVKDSINEFISIYHAGKGLYQLGKGGRGLNVEFMDIDDKVSVSYAQLENDKLLEGDDFKLSEEEKNKAKSSNERNKFMTKEGVTYATFDESAEIVSSVINITGAVSKVTFDPSGIAAGLLKETAEFVKFVAKLLADDKMLDHFFRQGPGSDTVEKIANLQKSRGKEVDSEENLIKKAKIAMGLSKTMDLRTYIGRNIVTSILFSASEYNPLKGTRSRAEAVLKALGLNDIIGQVDELSAMKLYNALLGNYGIELSKPVEPTPIFKNGQSLEGIYNKENKPQKNPEEKVKNGINK